MDSEEDLEVLHDIFIAFSLRHWTVPTLFKFTLLRLVSAHSLDVLMIA